MDEFDVDEDGRLSLSGTSGSPFDEPITASWDPSDDGDPEPDPDDDEDAWLRSLPADIRAEVLARPPLPAPPWQAGPEQARASFATGGLGDTVLPGAGLGQLLAEALLDGYADLTDDELTGVMRAWQRQAAHCQARLAAAVSALVQRRADQARQPGSSLLTGHVIDETAIELTLTARSARRLADISSGLRRLPDVNSALLSGLIDWPRACVFVDELAALDDTSAREIAERLADRAAGWTTGQLRAALVRAVLAADPDAAERRRKTARKDARVEVWGEPSGNAVLAGRELAPADAIAADAQLRADASWAKDNGAEGTIAELRAAAFIARLTGQGLSTLLPSAAVGGRSDTATTGGWSGSAAAASDRVGCDDNGAAADNPAAGPGSAPRPAGSIHLTMPMSTWLGGGEPGEVAGHGPVDGDTGRDLAARLAPNPATRWCLTLTGPDGQAIAHACSRHGPAPGEPITRWAAGLRDRLRLLETGTCSHARRSAGYPWPGALRHLIGVRQRTCSAPGCRRPARRSDIDHTIPFEKGGLTCECNGSPLCRRHHRAKQAPGWHLSQHEPGQMTWRLPSGREYQTTGPPYPG